MKFMALLIPIYFLQSYINPEGATNDQIYLIVMASIYIGSTVAIGLFLKFLFPAKKRINDSL